MKKLLALLVLAAALAAPAIAAPRKDYVTRIESCRAVLENFQDNKDYAIPPQVWERARAVVIINQFRAGFILGVKTGYGVVLAKRSDNSWSIPVMISAGEASFGLQLGGSDIETIYIITNDETVKLLYKAKFNLGADAKAVAGPRWAEAEAVNKEILATPVLVYTKAKGLYAGATLKAGYLSRNDRANQQFYETSYTLPELLYGNFVTPPQEVLPLISTVKQLSP
jgi:SH3 domain-containing YSC84-like protein 1